LNPGPCDPRLGAQPTELSHRLKLAVQNKNHSSCAFYNIRPGNESGLCNSSQDLYRAPAEKIKPATSGLPGARSEISEPNVYKISRQFHDIFVGFARLKTQKMHIFFCPHKCYSLKQISIAVLKCY